MEKGARTALSRLAESQLGLFSAAQAARLGISRAQLSRATRHGYLRRPRSAVYAFGGVPASPLEAQVAAALAAGPDAVVSHRAAASIHRLHGISGGPIAPELTVPRQQFPRLSGVVIHRAGPLPREDVSTRYGVQVTWPARTLIDLASCLGPAALARVLDEGLIERRWGTAELKECLLRTVPNAHGRPIIEGLLALRAEGPAADSVLEARAFAALRPLAPFKTHFVIGIGKFVYVIDAAWPVRRVGAEIVGRSHRAASRSAFDRERRKLNALVTAGWRIAHLTAAMSADEMVATVRALLT